MQSYTYDHIYMFCCVKTKGRGGLTADCPLPFPSPASSPQPTCSTGPHAWATA